MYGMEDMMGQEDAWEPNMENLVQSNGSRRKNQLMDEVEDWDDGME